MGRLELPASCSQMCVGTFSRHSSVLFGPFLCLGSSSLTLFCPACFKKLFRLLGFVWDWILCIKRCSARFGAMTGQSPQNRGAGTAPHKQRIKPVPRQSERSPSPRKSTAVSLKLFHSTMPPYKRQQRHTQGDKVVAISLFLWYCSVAEGRRQYAEGT